MLVYELFLLPMKPSRKFWYLLALLMIVLSFWYLSIRNRLVSLSDATSASWDPPSQQLQRRYSMMNHLVHKIDDTSKETSLNPFLTMAEESYGQFELAQNIPDKVKAANQIESEIKVLTDHISTTTKLNNNPVIQTITHNLTQSNNRLLLDIKRYNDNAEIYNLTSLKFPYSAVIRLKHFNSVYPVVVIFK